LLAVLLQDEENGPGDKVLAPCLDLRTLDICAVVLQVGYRRDQYKRCANLLEAVSQLLEYFAHYQDVPKIQSLTKRLTVVQVRAEDVLGDIGCASSAAGAGGAAQIGQQ
jgi:hypothetical protein